MGLELPAFSISGKILSFSHTFFMTNCLNMFNFLPTGHYDIDGVAALILPIYGKGPFTITVSGIQLTGGSKIAIIFGGFKVKDLQYNLSLSDINVRFEGLLGGGEFGEVFGHHHFIY